MQAVEHRHDLVGKLRIILPVFHQPVLEPDEGLHIMHHIGAPVHLLDGGGQLDQVVGYLLFLQILVRVLDGVVDNGEDLLRDLLACHSVTGFQLPPSFLADPPAERLAGDPRHLDDPFLRDSLEVQSLGGIFRLMSGSCHNELFFLQRCTAERPEGKKMRGRCTQC